MKDGGGGTYRRNHNQNIFRSELSQLALDQDPGADEHQRHEVKREGEAE